MDQTNFDPEAERESRRSARPDPDQFDPAWGPSTLLGSREQRAQRAEALLLDKVTQSVERDGQYQTRCQAMDYAIDISKQQRLAVGWQTVTAAGWGDRATPPFEVVGNVWMANAQNGEYLTTIETPLDADEVLTLAQQIYTWLRGD